ncbi:hypothetical protein JW935_08155 [candidate division KSB1 bacterium]|nr:hypothetical protein [candidate division KSB1 bacterium]
MKYHRLFIVIFFLLPLSCKNDSENKSSTSYQDGDNKTSWSYAGTVWSIDADVAATYQPGVHAPALYCDGPSRCRYSGTFRIADRPGKDGKYEIEQIDLSAVVDYYHRRDENESRVCAAKTGSCETFGLMKIIGEYWYDEDAGGIPDPNPGTYYDRGNWMQNGFRVSITPWWEGVDEYLYNSPGCGFEYTCTDKETGSTYPQWATPAFKDLYYRGEATDRNLIWTEEDDEHMEFFIVRIKCLSDCKPPDKPDKKDCDPEELYARCQEAKAHIMHFCQTLNNWMVVEETGGPEPQITCGDADCAGAVEANKGKGPWVGISEHFDLGCEDLAGDLACSIECYGWGME